MIKGIDQQTNPESTSSEYIYWGKNGLSNRKLDASINELGNLEQFNLAPLNIQFKNGVTTLSQYIILFYKSNIGEDCIAVLDEKLLTVTRKVYRTDMGFNINYPIKAVAKFNPKNEIVVSFVDGLNTCKYINLDTALPIDSLNYYNLFPIIFSADDIQGTVLDSGSVTTGAYFGTFQYIAKDRTRSSWTTLGNPIFVTIDDPSKVSTQTRGTNAGESSNKSIKFTITNLDTTYSKIALAIISKVKGGITQRIVKEVTITGATMDILYNGTEFLSDVTLDELITDNVRYESARRIETLNDQLFLADLTIADTIDFQAVVNQTTLQWNSSFDLTNNLVNTSYHKSGNTRTFIHDEVYAFYMQFELLDGSFTAWFHIPGRLPSAGERANSAIYNGGLTINGSTPKVFQIEDTCTYIGTNGDGTKYGDMGAWENQDETYPVGFPGLAGEKVRHHKFPSIQYQSEVTWAAQTNYGINNLDLLSIKITNASIDYTVVKGYRIGYAKRSLSDTGVVGMGLVMPAGNPEISGGVFDSNTLISVGGNFRVNSLNGADDNLAPDVNGYIRYNSFDIWQDRPSITSTYLRSYFRLKTAILATGFSGTAPTYNDFGTIAASSYIPDSAVQLTAYASNFTRIDKITKTNIAAGDQFRKLSTQTYVPNNVKYTLGSVVVDNRGFEETVLAKVEGTALNLTTFGNVTVRNSGTAEDGTLAEETYLSALKVARANYFLSFDNQTVVINPTIFRNQLTTNTLTGSGDGFIGAHSYVTLAPYNKNAILSTFESICNFKMHVGVSRHNVNQRYQISGDYSSYFYSDGGLFDAVGSYDKYWFWLNAKTNKWNNFQYAKDFSTVNDFETFGIFNRDNINQDTFNYRIIRSTKANRENALEDGWKTFKATDYFDIVRNKGRITKLVAWGTDSLLIHCEQALFRTRDKAVLQTDLVNVTLGSGEIFALEPREEDGTPTGNGGLQHEYGALLTEIGYIFVDEQVKDVYIYDGQNVKEICKGLNTFFFDTLNCKVDNPFNADGLMIAYDQNHDRILLSQKAVSANSSFTVSFDILKQEWAFAHDYLPDGIFNSRKNLYSFKGNHLYTHNIGPRGVFYGVTYPFYVDYIVNDKSKLEKILANLNWLSKIKNADGSLNQRACITYITVWNDQHCTNKIALVTNETTSLFVDSNTKIVDETWDFNDLYDNVIDPSQPFVSSLLTDSRPIGANLQKPSWYDSEPLRGKFFIVRLEYDNIANKEVHLRELIPTLRESES